MTDKQKLFCDEYLIDMNATRAYKAVYATCKKDGTARTNGNKLLTKTDIQAYLDSRRKAIEEKAIITQEMILKELKSIAFDKEKEHTTNRLKAIELAGKHIGMFKETNMNVNMNYEEYLKRVDGDEY